MSPSADDPRAGARRDDHSRGTKGAPAKETSSRRISILEWVIAGTGLMLVLGVIAFLIVQSTHDDSGPPLLSVRVDTIVAVGDSAWIVRFTADNRARAAAAGVAITGEVGHDPDIETSHAVLDYVPGSSSRAGGLMFRRDPRGGGLRLRVEGYQEP